MTLIFFIKSREKASLFKKIPHELIIPKNITFHTIIAKLHVDRTRFMEIITTADIRCSFFPFELDRYESTIPLCLLHEPLTQKQPVVKPESSCPTPEHTYHLQPLSKVRSFFVFLYCDLLLNSLRIILCEYNHA